MEWLSVAGLELVQGLHAGVFFYRGSFLAAHELMKPHCSGLGFQSAFARNRMVSWWMILHREHVGDGGPQALCLGCRT